MNQDKLNQDIPEPAPLVEVTRGAITESRHRGHVVAVDGDGQMIAHLGAPETVSFLRSSSKPQQAIPLVASGAAARFSLDDAEVAIACGSHNGEPVHTETVRSMLRKIKLDESALRCGPHEPYSTKAADELRAQNSEPTALHNNCSGKHAGMLALALHLGAPVETYFEAASPVQIQIAHTVSLLSGVPVEDIAVGIDGCGVPTFGMTVRAMASMFVRLAAPLADWETETRDACRRIIAAMTEHPEMIEGEGELDTELMRRLKGRIVSKVGAEGVYAAAVLPSAEWPRGLGLAFKIEDGDKGSRARSPVVVETLRQLGVLSAADADALAQFSGATLRNRRGERVGEVRTSFELRHSS
ncbi:MAG TPA: asparaginase [Pyrinomonadaceae bacterium]|jgi:L-asparaginase II|nr:asparaginase [Pyrinomonadaceae bacterium]